MLYVFLHFHLLTVTSEQGKMLIRQILGALFTRVMIAYFCYGSTWLMFLESEKHFPSLQES